MKPSLPKRSPLALAAVVDCAQDVTATGSRRTKSERISALLQASDPGELAVVVGLLIGQPRQGRIGVGWSTLRNLDDLDTPALGDDGEPVTVLDLDESIQALARTDGPGSQDRRREILGSLLGRMTPAEVSFVRDVLVGGLRQGALGGVMADAIAKAFAVPAAVVRRGAMLSGDLGETATIAATEGRAGVEAIGLRVGRPVQPMLASTSTSATEAIADLGRSVVQEKLDGIRIQAHREGPDVHLFTRNLNDVTDRLPAVVDLVRSLPVDSVVLDGEVMGGAHDLPEPFQDTASTFSSGGASGRVDLDVLFFDILHRDGLDLIDEPLLERLAQLSSIASGNVVVELITADANAAEEFAATALDRGQEGVVVKSVDSLYAAGRRGKEWRKVKPVHTFDLVVLGAEWGHGRRQGWLSNLHLGARDEAGFVMVGKTFKGLTDELLTWQTEALLELEQRREGITVFVEPELVVEIALDGVQRSTTYPGGLALRFARVRRYRDDKNPADADTLDDLRRLLR